jgi:hypothetical protein
VSLPRQVHSLTSAEPAATPELAFRCRSLSVGLGVGEAKRRIIEGLDLEVPKRQFLCLAASCRLRRAPNWR